MRLYSDRFQTNKGVFETSKVLIWTQIGDYFTHQRPSLHRISSVQSIQFSRRRKQVSFRQTRVSFGYKYVAVLHTIDRAYVKRLPSNPDSSRVDQKVSFRQTRVLCGRNQVTTLHASEHAIQMVRVQTKTGLFQTNTGLFWTKLRNFFTYQRPSNPMKRDLCSSSR